MNTPTPFSTGIKFGLITACILVIYNATLQMSGLITNSALSFIGLALLIAGVIMSMRSFKNLNGQLMSYKQGLSIGTVTASLAGIIGQLFNYIYVNMIDDSNAILLMEKQREKLEKSGIDAQTIEKTMELMKKNTYSPLSILWGALASILVGFIISLVIAAVMKKASPEEKI